MRQPSTVASASPSASASHPPRPKRKNIEDSQAKVTKFMIKIEDE
jgi:hypothetical protein